VPEALGIVVFVVVLAGGVWLLGNTQQQLRQLRAELDLTQSQLNTTGARLNDVERQVSDLKAAADDARMPSPPPRLPRSRASGLDDLREQLRAAHREGDDSGRDE
jgi:hypothetical protein